MDTSCCRYHRSSYGELTIVKGQIPTQMLTYAPLQQDRGGNKMRMLID